MAGTPMERTGSSGEASSSSRRAPRFLPVLLCELQLTSERLIDGRTQRSERLRRAGEQAVRVLAFFDHVPVDPVTLVEIQPEPCEVLHPHIAIAIDRGAAEPASHVALVPGIRAEQLNRRVDADLRK